MDVLLLACFIYSALNKGEGKEMRQGQEEEAEEEEQENKDVRK